jgi:hypothetical protein
MIPDSQPDGVIDFFNIRSTDALCDGFQTKWDFKK